MLDTKQKFINNMDFSNPCHQDSIMHEEKQEQHQKINIQNPQASPISPNATSPFILPDQTHFSIELEVSSTNLIRNEELLKEKEQEEMVPIGETLNMKLIENQGVQTISSNNMSLKENNTHQKVPLQSGLILENITEIQPDQRGLYKLIADKYLSSKPDSCYQQIQGVYPIALPQALYNAIIIPAIYVNQSDLSGVIRSDTEKTIHLANPLNTINTLYQDSNLPNLTKFNFICQQNRLRFQDQSDELNQNDNTISIISSASDHNKRSFHSKPYHISGGTTPSSGDHSTPGRKESSCQTDSTQGSEKENNHMEEFLSDYQSLKDRINAYPEMKKGKYTREERAEKIVSYKKKIKKYRISHPPNRNFKGRSSTAFKKPRIKGKFVSAEDYLKNMDPCKSFHTPLLQFLANHQPFNQNVHLNLQLRFFLCYVFITFLLIYAIDQNNQNLYHL